MPERDPQDPLGPHDDAADASPDDAADASPVDAPSDARMSAPAADAPSDEGRWDAGTEGDLLASLTVDDVATPAERAVVEGTSEGRRRRDQLRAAADAVGEAVAPLDETTADTLVARALASQGQATDPEHAHDQPVATPHLDEVAARRAAPSRSARWPRVAAAVAAVAAALVLVVGLANLAGQGRSDSDSASESSAGGASATSGAADQASEAARDQARDSSADANASSPSLAGGAAPADLGALPDADVVLERYTVLRQSDPAFDHQFDAGSDGVGAAEGAPTSPRGSADLACPLPASGDADGAASPSVEGWTVTATALLPSGPVLVVSDGRASPENRVQVLDGTTCAVLAERTL